MSDCLFCRIVAGDVPADVVYADDDFLAFRDIAPQAPFHVLVIPRRHAETMAELAARDVQLAGRLLATAAAVAQQHGASSGFRTVLNTGVDGGQTVFHVHAHVLAGRSLTWPPG